MGLRRHYGHGLRFGLIIGESPFVPSAELGLLVLDTPKAGDGCLRSFRSEISLRLRDRSRAVREVLVDRVARHPGPSSYLVRVFLPIQPSHPVLVPALAGTCG